MYLYGIKKEHLFLMKTKAYIFSIIFFLSAFAGVFAQGVESSSVALDGVGVAEVEHGKVALRCHCITLTADSVSTISPWTF